MNSANPVDIQLNDQWSYHRDQSETHPWFNHLPHGAEEPRRVVIKENVGIIHLMAQRIEEIQGELDAMQELAEAGTGVLREIMEDYDLSVKDKEYYLGKLVFPEPTQTVTLDTEISVYDSNPGHKVVTVDLKEIKDPPDALDTSHSDEPDQPE